MAIQVIPIKYAKPERRPRQDLLAPRPTRRGTEYSSRASVSIDEESNSIIVHAIREDIAKTVALVERLDRAKRQVHIEARIVEATRDAARQLGVQWGGHVARVDDGRLVAGGGQGAGGYGAVFPPQFAQTLDPWG
jgi:type IV pilus assembly protein PilQ